LGEVVILSETKDLAKPQTYKTWAQTLRLICMRF
jgi:hypothetical protein